MTSVVVAMSLSGELVPHGNLSIFLVFLVVHWDLMILLGNVK